VVTAFGPHCACRRATSASDRDFGGVRKEVCLSYLPETEIGDYVVVHVGFAISRLDEDEALRTLEIIAAMPGAFAQEFGPVAEETSAR